MAQAPELLALAWLRLRRGAPTLFAGSSVSLLLEEPGKASGEKRSAGAAGLDCPFAELAQGQRRLLG